MFGPWLDIQSHSIGIELWQKLRVQYYLRQHKVGDVCIYDGKYYVPSVDNVRWYFTITGTQYSVITMIDAEN